MENNKSNSGKGIGRRDILKGLAAIPVLGALWAGASTKGNYLKKKRLGVAKELNIQAEAPPPSGSMAGDPIRIGIVGFGIRGKQLMRAMGFATSDWKNQMQESALENSNDTRLKDFQAQENLNIRITGVCDIFSVYAEDAKDAGTADGNTPKIYKHYQEMLASPDIDAVVIATPDHWHAPIAIDAINAGKHVYVEKCMTHKLQETYDLYDAVKTSGKILQVGHQHRQTQSFLTAIDIVKKNVLGHISLIQTNTNRNSDNGAWQYNIHEKANPQTIDWAQFLGNAPEIPFNKEHFFRWRKWWAYGTGLTGDLLTHDYDRINCILKMGIPSSVMTSGGVYTHKDGREVPDVLQVIMEYPDFAMSTSQEPGKEKGMTFIYSATLGNQFGRQSLLMGHDATMELGNTLTVFPDPRSTRYADMLEAGKITAGEAMYSYNPSAGGVDGVTSATAQYFANKGLLYTYRDGKRVDSTHLHIREWLSCIRHGGTPSCDIERGFEEAISAHMSTISYRTGRRVEWDAEARKIIGFEKEELDAIGIA
ncbi:MAG: Gfo/Idh/MocA family oxidoreductase [Bacteroidetes bacterium]|nr:Gfo/Idh/MocA family oxidoreductase [Bacteroidota bacterium]